MSCKRSRALPLIGLLVDGYQYFGWNDGDGALSGVGSGYNSSLTNVAAQLSGYNAKFALSYQMVSGDSYVVAWDGGTNDETGFSTWNSVQRLDFERGGEQSWQARFDYNLVKFVEGLSFMTRYTNGSNISNAGAADGSEWERDIELKYSPPMIENLSFRWRNAYVKSSQTYQSDENRFIVNYTLAY